MEDGVAQFAVIGHEQCPFGVEIEPSDGKEAQRDFGDQIGDDGPALGIGEGGDIAGGFVEEDIHLFFKGHRFAVAGDPVMRRVGLAPHLHDDLAIDPNPAVADQLLGAPP